MQGGQDQMAGHRGVKCSSGCVRVANLTHENDVRILPQDGPECLGKCQAGFFVHLHLADPIDFIFDRVFDRHDVQWVPADFIDARIEGGGFAAAGRTHGKQHSLRTSNQRMQAFLDFGLKSDLREGHEGTSAPQQSNDDLLAPSRRQDGDSKIEPARFFCRDVPILWKPPFTDVELREYFDSNGEVLVHPPGDFQNFLEQTVDAVADSR